MSDLEQPLNGEYRQNTQNVEKSKVMQAILGVVLLVLVVLVILVAVTLGKVEKLENDRLQHPNHNDSHTKAPVHHDNGTAAPIDPHHEAKKKFLSAIDSTTDPCKDFYQFSCGGWLAKNEIPSDKSRITRSFGEMGERNLKIVRSIIDGKTVPLLNAFMESCEDYDTRENLGYTPISDLLDFIATSSQETSDMTIVGHLTSHGINVLFGIGFGVDEKTANDTILQLGQGGLGVSKFVYSNKDLVDKYVVYYGKLLNFLSVDNHTERAQAVVDFEITLANAQVSHINNPYDSYNLYTKVNFTNTFGDQFTDLFKAMDLSEYSFNISVDLPSYISAVGPLITSQSKQVIQDYFTLRTLSDSATKLSSEFRVAHFEFYGKALRGLDQDKSLHEQCIGSAGNTLGMVIGKEYIKRTFTEHARNLTRSMIEAVEEAFARKITSSKWLDEPTKQAILDKEKLTKNIVGYPDNWGLYYGFLQVDVNPHTYYQNVHNGFLFGYNRGLGHLKDRHHSIGPMLWQMTPQQVNAYFEPTQNLILFPAGILGKTFFDVDYPSVLNMAGIGQVMGHELSHAFDNQGSLYDGYGRLRNTWTKQSRERYNDRTRCFSRQYSAYEFNGNYVDGNLTLGENLADNSGINEAFNAWKKWKVEHGEERFLEEYTDEQTFFIQFAQSYCNKYTKSALENQIKTDPHSPGILRATVPPMNMKEFATAFQCPEKTTMNPEKRCHLWY